MALPARLLTGKFGSGYKLKIGWFVKRGLDNAICCLP